MEEAQTVAEQLTAHTRGVAIVAQVGGDMAIVFEERTIALVRSDPKGVLVQYFDKQGWRFTRDIAFARNWIKRGVRGERKTHRIQAAREADVAGGMSQANKLKPGRKGT